MKPRSDLVKQPSIRRGLSVAGLSALGLAGMASHADAAILVDDFSSATRTYPASLTVDTVGLVGSVETGLTGAIGGGRNLNIGNASMDVDGFDNVTVSVFTTSPSSFFDYNSTVGTQSQAVLQYGNATTLPALNLNATGETTLRLDLLNFDAPTGLNLNIQAQVISSAGGGVFPLPGALVLVPGPTSVNLPLTGLSPAALADIDGIQISFLAPKSGDFRVDNISLVPEPATMALFTVGALCSLATRRRI